jgi:hypothetical protein
MEPRRIDLYKRSRRFQSGLKTAVFIIVLGLVAVLADRAYFVSPHAHASMATMPPAAELPVSVQSEGFALPENLHPTAADVQPPPPSF